MFALPRGEGKDGRDCPSPLSTHTPGRSSHLTNGAHNWRLGNAKRQLLAARVTLCDNQVSPRRVNKAPFGSSQQCLLISEATSTGSRRQLVKRQENKTVAKNVAQKCFIINSHSAKDSVNGIWVISPV